MRKTIKSCFYIDTFHHSELREVIDRAREVGYREQKIEEDMLVLEREGSSAYITSETDGHILWEKSARRR